MTNPLVAIEQITYLLFLKQLEALNDQRILEKKPSSAQVDEDPALCYSVSEDAYSSGSLICKVESGGLISFYCPARPRVPYGLRARPCLPTKIAG
jgi:hypothetical protein